MSPRKRWTIGFLFFGTVAYPAFAAFTPDPFSHSLGWLRERVHGRADDGASAESARKLRGPLRVARKRFAGSKPFSPLDPQPVYGDVQFAPRSAAVPAKRFNAAGASEPRKRSGRYSVEALPSGSDPNTMDNSRAQARIGGGSPIPAGDKKDAKKTGLSSDAPAFLSVKTEIKSYSAGQAKSAYLGFALPGQRLEVNDVKDLKMEFATRDDWVKISTRQSESNYQANPGYLFAIAGRNPFGAYLHDKLSQDKTRFLFNNQPIGTARLERVDLKLLDMDYVKLSGFAFHSQTGDAYYSDLARRNPNDDFAVSNRRSLGFGEKLSIGPLSLTSRFKRSERIFGENTPTERLQDHIVALDLDDLSRRLGAKSSMLSALAPTSLYGGISSKSTLFKTLADGPPDETKGVTAGAHWGWENASLDVNYFKYALNSRRVGDENYDSAGRGGSASLSAWTDRFLFSGGLSLMQSDVLPTNASSRSQFVNAYASSTLRLDDLPDVFADVAAYRSQYSDRNNHFDSTSWSSSIGLDLSKYATLLAGPEMAAASSLNFTGASLRALYRYQSGMDYILPGQGGPTGHFVGFSFRTALK